MADLRLGGFRRRSALAGEASPAPSPTSPGRSRCAIVVGGWPPHHPGAGCPVRSTGWSPTRSTGRRSVTTCSARPILTGVAADDRADRHRHAHGHPAGCAPVHHAAIAQPDRDRGSWVYIWFFRGTPVLVQLLFWYNAAYIFPSFSLGVPFGPALIHFNLNSWLTPFVAACIGLALNEGAYMAEIIRAGIISVDEGQTEAAQSLGMSRLSALRLIVLPQAMRVVIPPTGNETISMLKTSSLASVVVAPELLYRSSKFTQPTITSYPCSWWPAFNIYG